MNVFLRELSKKYKDDIGLLCCDGAAWHKSKTLEVPENNELFFIPPYTPEMNPIEQIWKELRKMGLEMKYSPLLNGLLAAFAILSVSFQMTSFTVLLQEAGF